MTDQSNPWGTTEAADSAAQSADAWGSTPAPADGGGVEPVELHPNAGGLHRDVDHHHPVDEP